MQAHHLVGEIVRKELNLADRILEAMLGSIRFSSAGPTVVDLSVKTHTALSLTERKVECVNKEKDLILFYFLIRYPRTRALIFVNSIDSVRRLLPLFRLLLPKSFVGGIHGEMDQKQRFKTLERYACSFLDTVKSH